jgi:hypothetical protein
VVEGVVSRDRLGVLDDALAAECVPRAAPKANAAVIAAAPPAAQTVIVLTRRRAAALSIAMVRSLDSSDKSMRSRV